MTEPKLLTWPVPSPNCVMVVVLDAIKAHFREDPRRLFMEQWYVRKGSLTHHIKFRDYDYPPCGTVACIAGWICLLFGDKQPPPDFRETETANALMGLGSYTLYTDRLYYLDKWPEEFRDAYKLAHTPEERTEVTCNRIDHFIKHLA